MAFIIDGDGDRWDRTADGLYALSAEKREYIDAEYGITADYPDAFDRAGDRWTLTEDVATDYAPDHHRYPAMYDCAICGPGHHQQPLSFFARPYPASTPVYDDEADASRLKYSDIYPGDRVNVPGCGDGTVLDDRRVLWDQGRLPSNVDVDAFVSVTKLDEPAPEPEPTETSEPETPETVPGLAPGRSAAEVVTFVDYSGDTWERDGEDDDGAPLFWEPVNTLPSRTLTEAHDSWGPLTGFVYVSTETPETPETPERDDEVMVSFPARYQHPGRLGFPVVEATGEVLHDGHQRITLPNDATFTVVKKAAPPVQTYYGVSIPQNLSDDEKGVWKRGVREHVAAVAERDA